MQGKRLNYIDRLKGLAIFMVVFGHVLVHGLQNYDDIFRVFASSFHMPLFMFLSGLVISKIPTPRKFVVKAIRYLCPFFIIGLLFNFYVGRSLSVFFLDKAKSGYWYLWVLTEFYALIMLLWCNHNNKSTRGIIIDIFFLAFVLIVFVFLESQSPILSDIFTFGSCKNYWPFFFGGYLFHKYNLIEFMKAHARLISSVSVIVYICMFYVEVTFHLSSFVNAITGLAAICFLLLLFEGREMRNSFWDKELLRLGNNSLEIYIFEYFFLANINLHYLEVWFIQSQNYFLQLLFVLFMAIAISYSSLFVGKLSHKAGLLDDVIYGNFAPKFIKY